MSSVEHLRVLLVDDEAMARSRLRRLLAKIPDLEVVGEAGDGDSLITAFDEHRPNLLFLDVQMPGTAVFDALKQRAIAVEASLVFVTAFDRYAAQAFEIEAVHYLLKPISREGLETAIARVRKRRGAGSTSELAEAVRALERRQQAMEERLTTSNSSYVDRLLVKHKGAEFLIPVGELEAVEAAGNYVALRTPASRYLMRGTLHSLEQSLDPRHFVRIHRTTVVNLDKVQQVQPWFWGDSVVITTRGQRYKMSRRYREGFYERFKVRPDVHLEDNPPEADVPAGPEVVTVASTPAKTDVPESDR